PAPYSSVDWTALAFCCIAQPPIASARIASPIQLSNQSSLDGRRLEMSAVKSALIPIRMPPQPGTAVKEPARSIVSRMYLRFSTARSLMDTTVAFFIFMTIGVRSSYSQVLYYTKILPRGDAITWPARKHYRRCKQIEKRPSPIWERAARQPAGWRAG